MYLVLDAALGSYSQSLGAVQLLHLAQRVGLSSEAASTALEAIGKAADAQVCVCGGQDTRTLWGAGGDVEFQTLVRNEVGTEFPRLCTRD